jgi:DNA-binding MarR family transcriptional regulator
MSAEIERIGDLFLNVIGEFYEEDRKARTFGTSTALYHSEIHMIACIAEHPDFHISALARALGITRGAASQTVKRLERKQMILRERDKENHLKVLTRLSGKGRMAYRNHRSAHLRYRRKIAELLASSGNAKVAFLADFLQRFEKIIKPGHAGKRSQGHQQQTKDGV